MEGVLIKLKIGKNFRMIDSGTDSVNGQSFTEFQKKVEDAVKLEWTKKKKFSVAWKGVHSCWKVFC